MPGPGPRGGAGQERTGRVQFKDIWMDDLDKNGDSPRLYVQKTSLYTFKCTWCQTSDLAVDNIGKTAIFQHAGSKCHRTIANNRSGRTKDQVVFNTVGTNNDEDEPTVVLNNNEIVELPTEETSSRRGGIKNFFKSVEKPATQPNLVIKTSLETMAVKAEIKIALKAVESNWSYRSLDNFSKFLADLAPDSQILQKVKMKSRKLSYTISHGLGPHFHDILLKDLMNAPCFTLGLDSATTKHLGLSKYLDFKLRFFSERLGMVVDMFFDCHNLGHETADIMAVKIVESLEESGLSLKKLITLSRDNPTVMKALDRKLREKAESIGNPRVLNFPDYLHPTHTALREGMKELGSDLENFLVNVHGFFKLSTGRREDMLKVREIFEENDQFFIRFVSSRWLSTGPVAERIVEHWASLGEYFLTFIPSKNDQSSKDAMDTVRYTEIVGFLKPSNNQKNLARMKFLIYLCKVNTPFLLTYQSEKPKIHRLYTDCMNLVVTYMNLICEPSKIPSSGSKMSQINFKESGLLLPSSKCFFGPGAEKEVKTLQEEKREQVRMEFRTAIVNTVKYLISHFPLKNGFLMDLTYMDPDMRADPRFVKKLVAEHTGRFSDHELEDLAVQLQTVKALTDISEFNEVSDQLDIFWLGICRKVEKVIKEKPEALLKLVKIVCSLPHSNAFLERGFSDLKRIITSRESLSVESIKAHKTILDFIRLAGGTEEVGVTQEMIECVKQASLIKEQERRRQEREEESTRLKSKKEEQDREKKRKLDDEKRSWEAKKQMKADTIEVLQEKLNLQSQVLKDSMNTAEIASKNSTRMAALKSAMETQKAIDLTRELLEVAHKQMEKIIGKKPKNVLC